jgi:hypothetical protein
MYDPYKGQARTTRIGAPQLISYGKCWRSARSSTRSPPGRGGGMTEVSDHLQHVSSLCSHHNTELTQGQHDHILGQVGMTGRGSVVRVSVYWLVRVILACFHTNTERGLLNLYLTTHSPCSTSNRPTRFKLHTTSTPNNQDVHPYPTAIPNHPSIFGFHDFVHPLLERCWENHGHCTAHQPEI